jgi:phytoene synthase
LAYVPASRRPAIEALWRLDVTFAAILATGRDRMVGRIRLAWWREALERLDHGAAPPEPLLRALQAHVLPAGLAGAALAAMEEGWAVLLSDSVLGAGELNAYAGARGGRLFRLSAHLLGDSNFPVERAGALWALADLARHSANPEEAKSAFAIAQPEAPQRWPRTLRPLGMLAALARRDVRRARESREPQGSPARMLRMIRHRLTGT